MKTATKPFFFHTGSTKNQPLHTRGDWAHWLRHCRSNVDAGVWVASRPTRSKDGVIHVTMLGGEISFSHHEL